MADMGKPSLPETEEPGGPHVPVLLAEVLAALEPAPRSRTVQTVREWLLSLREYIVPDLLRSVEEPLWNHWDPLGQPTISRFPCL